MTYILILVIFSALGGQHDSRVQLAEYRTERECRLEAKRFPADSMVASRGVPGFWKIVSACAPSDEVDSY